MDFPLPLTLVLMMTDDASRAAEAASSASAVAPVAPVSPRKARESVAPPRSSGTFAIAAPFDRAVRERVA